ncbi:hypothetical protein B0J18DRAFT_466772 [Chaetomium sp. MPI-SDFR-AT-0129]|nr:hypothetical protein B0J18DRAFT_466772 [Chaetomium sp. MPI-SDFR-AT-0129]
MASGSLVPPFYQDETFTAEMRDRQARGKDPTSSADNSDRDERAESRLRLGSGRVHKEDFAQREKRQKAIAFLDNPELLRMYAESTGETMAAARFHFTKMLCGYDEDDAAQPTGSSALSPSHRDNHHHPTGDRRGGHSPQTRTT